MNNKTFKLPRCLINGFNTSNINRQLPFHQVNFGIQFHPAAIHKLFGFHGHEFSNLAIDVTLIDATFQTLWYQLAEQSEFEHRVSIIANWLQQKKIELHPQEILLSSFLESKGPPVWTVLELSNLACYSPRHLSRKMIELTGMNAETILLYKKYLNAVQLIHHHKMTLTEIAYSSNFSDQSHFTRSFKLFAQSTPSEYLRKMSFVPGHIFENVR